MSIMDVKVDKVSSGKEEIDASSSVKKRRSFFDYVYDLKEELKKVTWTSRAELFFSTKMVVLSAFVFGFSVYFVDLCVKGLLETIKKTLHFIFG
ncbi:MAG: preprotein translocase subunit SecE [Chlamydiae bacterium]|nr:preprotein translocase subunit SecE [Chlamydiota bacterium]